MTKIFSLFVTMSILLFSLGCDDVNPLNEQSSDFENTDFSLSDSGGVRSSRAVPIPGTWHHISHVKTYGGSTVLFRVADIASSPTSDEIAIACGPENGMIKGLWKYSYASSLSDLQYKSGWVVGGNTCHAVTMDRDGYIWGCQDLDGTFITTIWCINGDSRVYQKQISMLENPVSIGYGALDIGCGLGSTYNSGDPVFDKGIMLLDRNGYGVYRLGAPTAENDWDFKYSLIDNLNVAQGAYLGRRIDASHANSRTNTMVLVDNYKQPRISDSYRQYVWWNQLDTEEAQDIAIQPTTNTQPEIWMMGKDLGTYGGRIYRWNYTTSQWDEAGGRASRVTIDRQGRAWIVNEIGDVFVWY